MKLFFIWENYDFLDPWRIAGGHTDGSSAYGYDASRVETCYRWSWEHPFAWNDMCIGNTSSHLHSVGVGGGQGRIGASWPLGWVFEFYRVGFSLRCIVCIVHRQARQLFSRILMWITSWATRQGVTALIGCGLICCPCTYVQKTNRHKIQYSIAQMYRFQTSLDIFRLLTFLNAVTSHLFWGSSVGYSSIRWWAGAARHPGTGGKGKNHVRCLVFKDLVSIHVKRFQVDSFAPFFTSFWGCIDTWRSLDLTPLHRKHWFFHLFSGG